MGCFNVSCALSGISIGSGDPIVVIPTELQHPDRDYGNCWNGDAILGLYGAFNPSTLPIHGKYNHYGGIKDVNRDWNVELIENFFEADIDAIINYAGHRDNNDTDFKPSEKLSRLHTHLFIHEEVFDIAKKEPNMWMYTSFENRFVKFHETLSKWLRNSDLDEFVLRMSYSASGLFTYMDTLPKLYVDRILGKDDDFKRRYIELCHLQKNFYAAGRDFVPGGAAPQDGEDQQHITLLKKFVDILEQRELKRNEE